MGEDKKTQAAPEKKGLLSLPLKQMAAGAALGAITGGFLAMAFGGPMGLMVFGGAAMLACMALLMNKK